LVSIVGGSSLLVTIRFPHQILFDGSSNDAGRIDANAGSLRTNGLPFRWQVRRHGNVRVADCLVVRVRRGAVGVAGIPAIPRHITTISDR
jgi:hypothetical protein